jgi:hypothetical protein
LGKPDQRALAQGRALMRAAIEQSEIFALDVEDRDRPVVDGDEFARPRRQFADRGDDMLRHGLLRMILIGKPVPTFPDHATPYTFFALPR